MTPFAIKKQSARSTTLTVHSLKTSGPPFSTRVRNPGDHARRYINMQCLHIPKRRPSIARIFHDGYFMTKLAERLD
jgi:hypothetical protein